MLSKLSFIVNLKADIGYLLLTFSFSAQAFPWLCISFFIWDLPFFAFKLRLLIYFFTLSSMSEISFISSVFHIDHKTALHFPLSVSVFTLCSALYSNFWLVNLRMHFSKYYQIQSSTLSSGITGGCHIVAKFPGLSDDTKLWGKKPLINMYLFIVFGHRTKYNFPLTDGV